MFPIMLHIKLLIATTINQDRGKIVRRLTHKANYSKSQLN
ncbi:hypothetical protein P106B_07 [Rhizobium phage vB_RglS_P106B]|uniref:Uncharacterized protein n=1 Tax=Rhizobium phage vB_RglS_P106B TaxID=1458697 RepID=W6E8D5_9CAUD|nr:hypothetical protein P106B_07 [Rhizobium phage vB_RglS_P106B]AHJ10690.1 hypothetical protein P106B_07 [Rhizobium phage vB_RglS_P106B]